MEDQTTSPDDHPRLDRRTAMQWMLAASASPSLGALGQDGVPNAAAAAKGYGPDPDLMPAYQPGELWPLTFTDDQRKLAITLCDLIVPADDVSPSASSVGVHDFLDEWISSPYPGQASDRNLLLKGFEKLDEAAKERGAENFVALAEDQQIAICQELAVKARKDPKKTGRFFLRLRDLVAGGYYTTPVGMHDLGYRGNVAMATWDGPTPEALAHLGLEGEE